MLLLDWIAVTTGDVEIVSAVGEVRAVVPPELLVVTGEAELEGGERV